MEFEAAFPPFPERDPAQWRAGLDEVLAAAESLGPPVHSRGGPHDPRSGG